MIEVEVARDLTRTLIAWRSGLTFDAPEGVYLYLVYGRAFPAAEGQTVWDALKTRHDFDTLEQMETIQTFANRAWGCLSNDGNRNALVSFLGRQHAWLSTKAPDRTRYDMQPLLDATRRGTDDLMAWLFLFIEAFTATMSDVQDVEPSGGYDGRTELSAMVCMMQDAVELYLDVMGFAADLVVAHV